MCFGAKIRMNNENKCVLKSAQMIKHVCYSPTGWNHSLKIKKKLVLREVRRSVGWVPAPFLEERSTRLVRKMVLKPNNVFYKNSVDCKGHVWFPSACTVTVTWYIRHCSWPQLSGEFRTSPAACQYVRSSIPAERNWQELTTDLHENSWTAQRACGLNMLFII